jgi:hypothetical protein
MPAPLRQIGVRSLSAESAWWIERHSTAWLIADPPGSKLSLLVQRQFWADRRLWGRYLRRRLLPIRKPHPLSDEGMKSAKSGLAYRAEDGWYKASRVWYHVRSDFEYLGARLRWTQHGHARANGSQRVVGQL